MVLSTLCFIFTPLRIFPFRSFRRWLSWSIETAFKTAAYLWAVYSFKAQTSFQRRWITLFHGCGKWPYLKVWKVTILLEGPIFWLPWWWEEGYFPPFGFIGLSVSYLFGPVVDGSSARAWTCTWKWHLGPWKGMTNIGHQPTRLEKVRLAYIFWATTPDSYYILIQW